MKMLSSLIILLSVLISSCQKNNNTQVTETPKGQLAVVEAFPNLDFERPIDLQNAGDQRVFVVEQKGIISVFDNNTQASKANIFLDIRNKVDDSDNEEGLLGLAFDPNFKSNGFFYVNYTVNSSETYISRFKVSANPDVADPASEKILLKFNQPYGNHNGGALAFGNDGYLYIATGDGGSGGDPKGNGQNLNSLLGKILRIDVNNQSTYGIPVDNPFVNQANAKPEIYAYGMRNPWRIAFDKKTNKLWAGDVGQNAFEEIDIVVKGGNYGWNQMEGLHPYRSGSNQAGFVAPVTEIAQNTGDKSITGGYVYNGLKIPSLAGKYIFADYVSGNIYSLTEQADGNYKRDLLLDTDHNISSFGLDKDGEIYICAFDGKIYKFVE